MAKIKQIILIILFVNTFALKGQKIVTGAEQVDLYIDLLKNKKVALVANQTSVINKTHLVDSLLSHNINIVKIFTPEHGFRGHADAGEHIKDNIDKKTNLPIISLYGKNKKPKKEQLSDIEIILFDIQDVGVRFYTYISTLHYIMEAGGENNISIIVLDRPNPNGHYVDGPVLDNEFISFVGMHPVPIVYGMTIGEYAKMINGEKWIIKSCDLNVIELKGYTHNSHYTLPIKPSPNLPNSRSINLYPSLCLFEGTNVSVGRGTEFPFQHFGAPYIKSHYHFIPKSMYGARNPKHKNIKCYGTDLRYQDNYLTEINLDYIINTYNESINKENFFNDFFDKLSGNDKLRLDIINGVGSKEIKQGWKKEINQFKLIRKRYLIY